jgi:hypothetical protein
MGVGDASVVQDRQVELAEPFGVGDELDLDGRVLS